MAKKISDLVAATQLGDNDSFVYNDVAAGSDKRVTASNLRAEADVVKVATVADLRNLEGKRDGQVVELLGYYTQGDGGGGPVYWDSNSIDPPNDGTIFDVIGITTGRWKRRCNPEVVKAIWFGADPNISDDQTSIIQKAINSYDNIIHVHVHDGIKFNSRDLTLIQNTYLYYRINDDIAQSSDFGNRGAGERVIFQNTSSKPNPNLNGGIANEIRYTSPLHPGIIVDVRKDISVPDEFKADNQSILDVARTSFLMADEERNQMGLSYIKHKTYNRFDGVGLGNAERLTEELTGISASNWTTPPDLHDTIIGKVSGAIGHFLSETSGVTVLRWYHGKFQENEALINESKSNIESSTTITSINRKKGAFANFRQDFEKGFWNIGLRTGDVEDEFAVGGLISSGNAPSFGQYRHRPNMEIAGFVWVDDYPNPDGFMAVYDFSESDPLKRRITLRKYDETDELGHIGAVKGYGYINHNFPDSVNLSSFNVQSVVKNGVGDYTITWKVPFTRADYAVTTTSEGATDRPTIFAKTTTVLRIKNYSYNDEVLKDLTGVCNFICLGGDI